MEKHVKEINADHFSRTFVVSDLHGEFTQLNEALDAVGFNKSEDLLVLHSDFLDRGDESIKAFHLINKEWVQAVKGNHEELTINAAFDSYLARLHINEGGEWFSKYDEDSRYIIARELEALPIVLEVSFKGKKYGFVHADVVGDDWEAFKALVRQHPNSQVKEGNVLWTALNNRERFNNHFKNNIPNVFNTVHGVDEIYLGHNIVPSHQRVANLNFIDTGAYKKKTSRGFLTLVELGV